MTITVNTVDILAAVAIILLYVLIARKRSSLPPGPPGLPFVGNALQIDSRKPLWDTFTKWSRQYGDIVHVSTFGRPLIILNSLEAINDLLEKRGALYSDRPRGVMATELSGFGTLLPVLPYGEQMRLSRKMLNDSLGQHNAAQWRALHEHNARECVSHLIAQPQEWSSHLLLMIVKTVSKITIGLDVHNLDDHFVQIAERALAGLLMTVEPGIFLVDVFPVLKYIPSWFPGAGFQRLAARFRESAADLHNEPYEMVKASLAQGKVEHSILATFLQENPNSNPEVENVCRDVTGITYIGTVGTSHAAVLWFFFAMVSWPEVQNKAQMEIDSVLNAGTLPTFADRSKLPYIGALLKEIYRWHPIGSMGVPHFLAKDDVYRGWHLPAGSTIVANALALSQNPTLYPDPERFMPERFLENGKDGLNPDPRSNGIAFGYGRRICPGQYLADDMLFIMVATILATVNIERALDENGNPVVPSANAQGNITSKPDDFPCIVIPRSSELASMLAAT